MSAPHIPNLSTLRSAHPSSRRRGRGQGAAPPPTVPSASEEKEAEEEKEAKNQAQKSRIIQLTDQDASISRQSAVEAGYLHDPFAHLFTPPHSHAPRRFPIINRGTYIRTTAIDNLVSLFLSQSPTVPKQIISLGAGSDTRFFRLSSSSSSPSSPSLIYHELDFAANTSAKIATITRSATLTQHIPPPITVSPPAADTLHSPTYHIHPCDLRTLTSSPPLPHINPSLPTLLISECCLCYLTPPAADSVATFFATHLFPADTPLGMILYEPINPLNDAFGKVMVSNLAARGIELHTLEKYASLEAQRERLRKYGFEGGVRAKDVDELWEKGVSAGEKGRVAGLEMVDEVEEWRLLARHYCVAWGWRDGKVKVKVEGEGGGDGEGMTKAVEDEKSVEDIWLKWRSES